MSSDNVVSSAVVVKKTSAGGFGNKKTYVVNKKGGNTGYANNNQRGKTYQGKPSFTKGPNKGKPNTPKKPDYPTVTVGEFLEELYRLAKLKVPNALDYGYIKSLIEDTVKRVSTNRFNNPKIAFLSHPYRLELIKVIYGELLQYLVTLQSAKDILAKWHVPAVTMIDKPRCKGVALFIAEVDALQRKYSQELYKKEYTKI